MYQNELESQYQSKVSQEIDLAYCKIHYEKPIVYFIFKEGTELGFPEMRECRANAEKLSGGKPYFTFSDVRQNVNMTKEGRKVASDEKEAPLHRGNVALVNSSPLKHVANFLANFSQAKYPFKAFTEKEKAIDWLLKLPLDK